MRQIALFLSLLLLPPLPNLAAQETPPVAPRPAPAALSNGLQIGDRFVVRLQDGGQIVGELKQETPDELTLIASFGEVKIARSKIKELTRITPRDIRKGEYWYPDPNQTRAFVFPTASTLPSGKGFYENYYLLFHSVHVGFTDNAMFSAGVALFPEGKILTVGPKLRVYQNPAKTVEAAVGGHLFIASGDDETGKAFIPYGVLSLGRPSQGRLNIGAGGIAVEGESAFFLNLSGDARLTRRVKAVGEVFVFSVDSETRAFPIYGLRFFSEKLAFDLGFWNIPDSKDLTAIGTPLVNFVFRF